MNGLHENTHLLESLKLLIQEVMRWKKVQELKKGKKIFKSYKVYSLITKELLRNQL